MRRIFFFLGLGVASFVEAGSQAGRVSEIHVRGDGLHYFVLENTHDGKPACATYNYWIIKDENSAVGKGQLAMLIAAQAQQKPVYVSGTGDCSRWPDGESVFDLMLKPG